LIDLAEVKASRFSVRMQMKIKAQIRANLPLGNQDEEKNKTKNEGGLNGSENRRQQQIDCYKSKANFKICFLCKIDLFKLIIREKGADGFGRKSTLIRTGSSQLFQTRWSSHSARSRAGCVADPKCSQSLQVGLGVDSPNRSMFDTLGFLIASYRNERNKNGKLMTKQIKMTVRVAALSKQNRRRRRWSEMRTHRRKPKSTNQPF
jgi:hypothetical protein